MEEGGIRHIMGKIEFQGQAVSIHWDKKWGYGSRTDYEYRISGNQALLWMIGTDDPSVSLPIGGQLGFYREKK
jgi:hypothetical protein